MSKRLQVLIPEQLDAQLRKVASRRGMSVGAWVRAALEQAFARDRSGDPLQELASLGGPTGDVDQILSDIQAGRT